MYVVCGFKLSKEELSMSPGSADSASGYVQDKIAYVQCKRGSYNLTPRLLQLLDEAGKSIGYLYTGV